MYAEVGLETQALIRKEPGGICMFQANLNSQTEVMQYKQCI